MFCSDLNGGVTREWRDVTPASPLLVTPQSSPAQLIKLLRQMWWINDYTVHYNSRVLLCMVIKETVANCGKLCLLTLSRKFVVLFCWICAFECHERNEFSQ